MTENEIVPVKSYKTKALIVGTVIGAAVGAAGAMLFIQAKGDDERIDFTLGEGVKIGVMLLGLLRSISSLAD
jgi:gas vesicle protein